MSETIETAMEYLARVNVVSVGPCMSLHVSKEGRAVILQLDNTCGRDISECIPGEGADISISREIDTGRVVRVRLPLYQERLVVSGEGMKTVMFQVGERESE